MRSLIQPISCVTLAISLLCQTSLVVGAEESKGFFSWNSNFIKKSESNKVKGIPANPPKKKIKGIPTQSVKNSADDELTEEEKFTIQSMSNNLDTKDLSKTLKNTVRPPTIRVPRAPKPFQIPQAPRVPQIPNRRVISIPSPPTAFSNNSVSSAKPEVPAAPSK